MLLSFSGLIAINSLTAAKMIQKAADSSTAMIINARFVSILQATMLR